MIRVIKKKKMRPSFDFFWRKRETFIIE
jgi:hypothetical protein